MHVYCSYSGGVPRASSSFLPLSGRGPAQSAEREWPKRGSKTKGRSFVGFVKGRSEWLASERTKKKLW